MTTDHPAVLITGASSGIGEYLAYEFARNGYRISLCARRTDKLRKVADRCLSLAATSTPVIVSTDVTEPRSIEYAVKKTLEVYGRLDCVVANAGFGVAGRFQKINIEDFQRQFKTNIDGVLNTVYASLEALKKSKGSLVIMGSVNSYVSQPMKAPYCMSKFAVRALAESLFTELKPDGVVVTLICPGMVESEIRHIDNQGVFRNEDVSTPPPWITMPTEVAARKMVCGILRRKREVIITRHARLGIALARFAPGFLLWLMSRFNLQGYKSSIRPV